MGSQDVFLQFFIDYNKTKFEEFNRFGSVNIGTDFGFGQVKHSEIFQIL